jgi:hypothetical protein
MTANPSSEQELQFANPDAPNYDWKQDREWFNQRLANARIHNSELEQENARLRREVEEICQQRATSPITRSRLRHSLAGVDWRKAK